MKLSVIIPVYNEASTLEEILERVKEVDVEKETILIDDGSTDGSREILQRLESEDPYLKVIYHQKNRGKGAALRTGFQAATGDYVIIQDADLEYDPQDYLKVLQPVLEGRARVVYGSRFMGSYKDMMTLHYWGNQLLTTLANLLYGVRLTDVETCYKLIPTDLVHSVPIRSDRFNFEPEITAKILKRGYKIVEVPISYAGRQFSEGKKITWRDGLAAFWYLLKYRFTD